MDRLHARLKRAGEVLGVPQPWLREFAAYLADPRMLPEEFWVLYALKRRDAQAPILAIRGESAALDYYRSSDYPLWRQVVHRRHSQWRTVLATMPADEGTLAEFGSGIAPVSAWLRRYKPNWRYMIEDIPRAPAFDYAIWRMKRPSRHVRPTTIGIPCPYPSVAVALDVFEHLAEPELEARRMVRDLVPGGYLHWNFVDGGNGFGLELSTPSQRAATIEYLSVTVPTIWSSPFHYIGRKMARGRSSPPCDAKGDEISMTT